VSHPAAVAALDCGTNSTRLLVADQAGRALVGEMRITRLGQGVDARRRLDHDAIDRTLGVLREFRAIMDDLDVGRARLAATSAVRDAANGADFLRAAADVTGVEAELLSGQEEGRLSYAGATAGLPAGGGPVLVLDIGGGSTELVTPVHGEVRSVSMDIGCVRLTERYLPGDPPTTEEVKDAVTAIGAALDWAENELPALTRLHDDEARLVGLAGTVSTLASLELGLVEYEREQIHHSVLTRTMVGQWCAILGAETVAQRAARPAMPEGRQDVIFGGALVLREVMERFIFDRCIVSESDILDGLVMSIVAPSDHASLPPSTAVGEGDY
jgi:exopolyphosphatase/guanosine-5'-triphosphate,3'-diphosphate pyrophosphatase